MTNLLRLRLIYLTVAVLPFCMGLVYGNAASSPPSSKVGNIKISVIAGQSGPAVDKLVDELQLSAAFNWSVVRTKYPAAAPPQGNDEAVVSIYTNPTNPDSRDAEQRPVITITPGRIRQDAQKYATLVKAVSESARNVGLADLFTAISSARVKLNVASLTSAGIDGELAQASMSLDQAIDSFSPVFSRTEPLIANGRAILNSFQGTAQSLITISDKISEFAREISALDATLGDAKDGLRLSEGALNTFRPALLQVIPLAESIDNLLSGSGSVNLQLLGRQVGIVLQLLGIELNASPLSKLLGSVSTLSPEDLSELLGSRVDRNTRVSDFLLAAAGRLRYFGTSIQDARRTFGEAESLFSSARQNLPKARAAFLSRLERFKVVVGNLAKQLDAATNRLPVASRFSFENSAGVGRLQLASVSRMGLDETHQVATVILMGAMAIALLRPLLSRLRNSIRRLIILLAILGVGVLTSLTMEVYGHPWLVFLFAVFVTVCMVEFYSLLTHLLGRWGSVSIIVLISLGIICCGHDWPADRVLPSYYVSEVLEGAVTGSSSNFAVMLAVLGVSGLTALILERKWAQLSPQTTRPAA